MTDSSVDSYGCGVDRWLFQKDLEVESLFGVPNRDHMVNVVRAAINTFGTPRFLITDHGSQFRKQFISKLGKLEITVVRGKVRCPTFNGKAERFFRSLRQWSRVTLLPFGASTIQHRLDDYADWFNAHRPHASLHGQTPNEAWNGLERPQPVPFQAANPYEASIDIRKRANRGDPALAIITISVTRKEAA